MKGEVVEIPQACKVCFDKQMHLLESAGEEWRVVLCPLLAHLALNSEYRTPLIERHFLGMAAECATETSGSGGLYTIQQVMGQRAAETAVAIRRATKPDGEKIVVTTDTASEPVELAA